MLFGLDYHFIRFGFGGLCLCRWSLIRKCLPLPPSRSSVTFGLESWWCCIGSERWWCGWFGGLLWCAMIFFFFGMDTYPKPLNIQAKWCSNSDVWWIFIWLGFLAWISFGLNIIELARLWLQILFGSWVTVLFMCWCDLLKENTKERAPGRSRRLPKIGGRAFDEYYLAWILFGLNISCFNISLLEYFWLEYLMV